MLLSSFIFGSSFEDYFKLRFYEKDNKERNKFVTTADQYEFQNKLNEKEAKIYFKDKEKFYDKFSDYIERDYFIVDENTKIAEFKSWSNGKNVLFCKPVKGAAGDGIIKYDIRGNSKKYNELLQKKKSKYLVEPKIIQHRKMKELNPGTLNTLKIITVQSDKNKEVEILGATIRMGTEGFIDNMSAGGIGAVVDLDTGKVCSKGIRKDITERDYEYHPITNKEICGFKIPHWQETKNFVRELAIVVEGIKTVGWDIAIGEDRPILIEGNENWNKDTLQIPANEGIKDQLLKYY